MQICLLNDHVCTHDARTVLLANCAYIHTSFFTRKCPVDLSSEFSKTSFIPFDGGCARFFWIPRREFEKSAAHSMWVIWSTDCNQKNEKSLCCCMTQYKHQANIDPLNFCWFHSQTLWTQWWKAGMLVISTRMMFLGTSSLWSSFLRATSTKGEWVLRKGFCTGKWSRMSRIRKEEGNIFHLSWPCWFP